VNQPDDFDHGSSTQLYGGSEAGESARPVMLAWPSLDLVQFLAMWVAGGAVGIARLLGERDGAWLRLARIDERACEQETRLGQMGCWPGTTFADVHGSLGNPCRLYRAIQ
jgi:hypothetical protein